MIKYSRKTYKNKRHRTMFDFDLQLFGGGGGGKSVGKMLGAIAFGILTGGTGMFTHAFWGLNSAGFGASFLVGAAMFSSVWNSLHPPKFDTALNDSTVQRFDKVQESMSTDGAIPVVYGMRKIAGNQTYHKANSDSSRLNKHVVLCEGPIEGIVSMTANGLAIPENVTDILTKLNITNIKYGDATVSKKGNSLYLTCNNRQFNQVIFFTTDFNIGNGLYVGERPNSSNVRITVADVASYINTFSNIGWSASFEGDGSTPSSSLPDGTGACYNTYFQLQVKKASRPNNTVLTIRNTKYSDATFYIESKRAYFHCNSRTKSIYLANRDDSQNESLWTYQMDVTAFISYVNQMGDGWEAFPYASTCKYCGDLWSDGKVELNCYNRPVSVCANTVTGDTHYTFHNGTLPVNYDEVGSYAGCAWLDMTFTNSAEINGGNPTVECIVKGRKVYDPRTGVTEYSTNPALCVLDFLTNERYGLGKWIDHSIIDMDSFKESADYCDEIVTFVASDGITRRTKRYELNMVIDQRDSAVTWLQNMLANFSGYLTYSRGIYALKVEKAGEIRYKFSADDTKDLDIAPLKLSETPNKYIINIIDPLNNWASSKCIATNAADIRQRGNIVEHELNLDGVTSQFQALRLARFYLDYNICCPIQISFTTGVQAIHLEPGDIVTVSYAGIFKDFPIRISEIKETEAGEFQISGRQYNATLYRDDLSNGIQTQKYAVIEKSSLGFVPNVTGVRVSQSYYVDATGPHASYTASWQADSSQNEFRIYQSFDDEKTWKQVGTSAINSFTGIANPQEQFKLKIVSYNSFGKSSTGVVTGAITITAEDKPPAAVNNLAATPINNSLYVTWSLALEPDVVKYNVYLNRKLIGTTETPAYTLTPVKNNHISVAAVDYSGQEGELSSVDIEYSFIPTDVHMLSLVHSGPVISISWAPSENTEYYTVLINNEYVFNTYNTYAAFSIKDAGQYSVGVKAVNAEDSSDYTTAYCTVPKVETTGLLLEKNLLEDIKYSDGFTSESIDISDVTTICVGAFILGNNTLQYRLSNDNSTWSDWIPFQPFQATTRYIQFKITGKDKPDELRVFVDAKEISPIEPPDQNKSPEEGGEE